MNNKELETNETAAKETTTCYQKIESGVVEGYKKVEDAVVGGYKKVEGGVVGGYRKIEDKFVDQFLTRDGETVEEAKARLKAENKTEE